jgi:hypothetical protein
MSRRLCLMLAVFSLLTLLVSCGGSGSATLPGDNATKLAQTAEFVLTATAAPNVTPPPPQTTTPPNPPPTAEPNPSPNPTAQPACTNNSQFVLDVTVPDGTHFPPGTAFDKTWRIQNTGTCAWDTTYQYRFIGGEPMAGQNMNLLQAVKPNETIDITVKFVSPMTAGQYRSQWRIFAPDGTPFGQRPYVEIVVP